MTAQAPVSGSMAPPPTGGNNGGGASGGASSSGGSGATDSLSGLQGLQGLSAAGGLAANMGSGAMVGGNNNTNGNGGDQQLNLTDLDQLQQAYNRTGDRGSQHHPIAEFLYQLTKMLTDDNSEIIEWVDGRIKVHYPERLEGEVLHKYFRHSKFASFQREYCQCQWWCGGYFSVWWWWWLYWHKSCSLFLLSLNCIHCLHNRPTKLLWIPQDRWQRENVSLQLCQ